MLHPANAEDRKISEPTGTCATTFPLWGTKQTEYTFTCSIPLQTHPPSINSNNFMTEQGGKVTQILPVEIKALANWCFYDQ